MTTFSITLESEFGGSWAQRLFGAPLLFWGLGAAAYVWRFGVEGIQAWFLALATPLQIGLLLAVSLLLTASGELARRLDRPLLRLLEGYWPQIPPFTWLAGWLRTRHRQRRERLEAEWQRLHHDFRQGHLHDPAARLRLGRLEALLHAYPDDPTHMTLPTRLGLRLRAAETRPLLRYGLDGVVCWPALWLVLPGEARDDLLAAYTALSSAVRAVFWALLAVAWSVWAPWALPLALVLAWGAYHLALEAADTFAGLVEAAFALYRFALYRALGLPMPTDPRETQALGRAITAHLWQGAPLEWPATSEATGS